MPNDKGPPTSDDSAYGEYDDYDDQPMRLCVLLALSRFIGPRECGGNNL